MQQIHASESGTHYDYINIRLWHRPAPQSFGYFFLSCSPSISGLPRIRDVGSHHRAKTSGYVVHFPTR